MRTHYFLKIAFISLFFTPLWNANAQSDFWKKIKIRKAFETNTADDDKAATFQMTFPKEGDDFFVINAGIGYEFFNNDTLNKSYDLSFTGFTVYNKNNQIDKEQDNLKIGVSSNLLFDRGDGKISYFGTNTLEYLKDYKEKSNSTVLTSYWHLYNKTQNKIKFGGYTQPPTLFTYFMTLQTGLEYQQKFESKNTLLNGNDTRGYGCIGTNLLLKKKTYDSSHQLLGKEFWTRGVELIINYTSRYSLFNNYDNLERYTSFFKTEIQYYPTQDNKLTFGLSFNKGENPIDALGKQEFWLLAIKFKK